MEMLCESEGHRIEELFQFLHGIRVKLGSISCCAKNLGLFLTVSATFGHEHRRNAGEYVGCSLYCAVSANVVEARMLQLVTVRSLWSQKFNAMTPSGDQLGAVMFGLKPGTRVL